MQIISRPDAVRAGLSTYFTGKPCARGHFAPRAVVGRNCSECNRAKCEAWHGDNREKANARRKAWTESNRQRHTRSNEAWRRRNLGKQRAYENRRRAKIAAGGEHSSEDIARILRLQRGLCACCLKRVTDSYHVDHVMPLALDGSNGPENLQILCPSCNARKHAKHPIAWRQQMGMLL